MASSSVDYSSLSPAERTDAIGEMAGLMSALEAELGSLVVAADTAGDWQTDGATSMAAWLVARCAWSPGHARDVMRVATALEKLPALRGALASGAVSWEQIRPATRFATPDTDAALARDLPGWSVTQVEALARQHTPKTTPDATEAHARRALHWRPDHHTGGFHYRGFLPTDMAAAVNEMIDGLAEGAGPDPTTGGWDHLATRRADALHHLATGETTTTLVVMHVDAEVVAGTAHGNGLINDVSVCRDTVLRHLCDTAITHTVEGPDGTCVGIGRRTQAIPRWLRRTITHRDRTCRFPGCDRRIRHIHHIAHWTRHTGPTDSHNLLATCWKHHHDLHEGGWHATGNANQEVTFTSPTGRQLHSRRQPIRPSTQQRAATTLGLPLDNEDDTASGPNDDAESPAGTPPSRSAGAREPASPATAGAGSTRPRGP